MVDEFALPADEHDRSHARLWQGTLTCARAAGIAVVAYVWLALTADGDGYRWLAVYGVVFAYCSVTFGRGEAIRWDAQLSLSGSARYRRAHGRPPPPDLLPGRRAADDARRASRRSKLAGGAAVGAGALCAALAGEFARRAAGGEGSVLDLLGAGVFVLVGWAYVARGNGILRGGRGHYSSPVPPGDLDPGSYVLYLRTFGDDRRLSRPQRLPGAATLVRSWMTIGRSEEERIAAALRWAGPLVAVGAPGEEVPPIGAARVYLPSDDWQGPVRDMMLGARLVVVCLGRGEGTLWELGEAVRLVPPERLVALVPMGPVDYEALRADLAGLGHDVGEIPEFVPRRTMLTQVRAIIYFRPDRQPVFVGLDRPPFPEDRLIGALDRALRPVVVQLTRYERRTGTVAARGRRPTRRRRG